MLVFRQFLSDLLGTYNPPMYIYQQESIIPDGFAGVDWVYLIRAVVFVVVLWSVLRLLGGLICRM